MNLLLVNDTSTNPNLGCQVTMFMLNRLVERHFPGASVERIFLSTINHPFTEDERRDLLPSEVTTIEQSADRMMRSPLPVLTDLVEKLRWADLVVINGEGSVLEDQANSRMVLMICDLASRLGAECHLINFTAHLSRPSAVELARHAFGRCATVSVREPLSYLLVKKFFPDVRLFPDIVIGVREELIGQLNGSQLPEPLVMIGGGSATIRMERQPVPGGRKHRLGRLLGLERSAAPMDRLRRRFGRIVRRLVAQGVHVRLMGWPRDEWLEDLAIDPRAVYEVPDFRRYVEVAGRSVVNFTGRHHGNVMSASAGCPFITTTANCFKNYGDVMLFGSPGPVLEMERLDDAAALTAIEQTLADPEGHRAEAERRRDAILPFTDGALRNIGMRIDDVVDAGLIEGVSGEAAANYVQHMTP
ncbi:polysaccharide pyruvyl transferase family protein [Tautonia marina]|uniref:polysaccharide pyruvyl transferase family protein n=1 Tax=Tautonia marina TaxID=2653855 RepID=UPI001260C311|nr:polysaccharide pyruvyl transferase family protein [Tautonia marina]